MFDLALLFKVGIVILAFSLGWGIRYIVPSLKDDNPIEEISEEVIKEETGFNIDLTPNSPEK